MINAVQSQESEHSPLHERGPNREQDIKNARWQPQTLKGKPRSRFPARSSLQFQILVLLWYQYLRSSASATPSDRFERSNNNTRYIESSARAHFSLVHLQATLLVKSKIAFWVVLHWLYSADCPGCAHGKYFKKGDSMHDVKQNVTNEKKLRATEHRLLAVLCIWVPGRRSSTVLQVAAIGQWRLSGVMQWCLCKDVTGMSFF